MKIFKTIDSYKVEEIKKVLTGLTKTEWSYIKGSIDMYFSAKAAEVKIDDLDRLDKYLKRKY